MAVWDAWVPGALSRKQLRELCDGGYIGNVADPDKHKIDHSSLDLHITEKAYQLVQGSVKPFGDRFLHQVLEAGLAVPIEPDGDGCFVLQPRHTYLFEIREHLEGFDDSFWGQATAKSSVGRLDVLARLIVNGMDHYEAFRPEVVSDGRTQMYVEVTPITFPVKVEEGVSLNQLRLFYGRPELSELRGKEVLRTCFAGAEDRKHATLSVDLSTVDPTGHEIPACGYSASESSTTRDPIPLWNQDDTDKPDPSDWWELVQPDGKERVRITKSRFYIFRSKERLSLPPGIAVYARATDEEIGEMRIHYAGFVHPNFGRFRADQQRGTPLIFEVRGHDVDVSLRDGEILARLQFYRMSEDSQPAEEEERSYNEQNLNLSKYFSETWSSPPMILPAKSELESSGAMDDT